MDQLALFVDERIQQVGVDQYRVASKSSPGVWHFVDHGACDCLGYEHRGTCRHIKLLVEAGHMTEPEVPHRRFTPPVLTPADAPDVWLWTARYQNKNLRRDDFGGIQTTVGNPRFHLGYPLVADLRAVAPERAWFGSHPDVFRDLYLQKLAASGYEAILGMLTTIHERHDGPLALLCFEDIRQADSHCHRWILVDWLQQHGFPLIPELEEG